MPELRMVEQFLRENSAWALLPAGVEQLKADLRTLMDLNDALTKENAALKAASRTPLPVLRQYESEANCGFYRVKDGEVQFRQRGDDRWLPVTSVYLADIDGIRDLIAAPTIPASASLCQDGDDE